MKSIRSLTLIVLASLLLVAIAARVEAGAGGGRPGQTVYVYPDDDVVVRRPTVSFLEVVALLTGAVGCFFGVAAFVEAKTAHRLIDEIKRSPTDSR